MPIEFKDIRVDARAQAESDRLISQVGARLDANETAHFARSLEYIKARTYDIKYGSLKALQFAPVDSSAGEGAETITYRQWDEVGMAKVIQHAADDLPQVDVFAREFTSSVISIGASYMWSLQDIARASRAGSDFMMRKVRAARNSVDRRIDEIGAFGATEAGTTGISNNAAVPVFAVPNAGAWSGLTAAQLLANLHAMAQAVVDQSNTVELPDTIILPTAEYGVVATESFSATIPDTVLSVFLRTNPYITSVQQWSKLDTAGAASAPRALTYRRSEEVLSYNIPLLFAQLPPQPENLSFSVPVYARVGVVEWHYPLAAVYSDLV